jgi:hypothetical protein
MRNVFSPCGLLLFFCLGVAAPCSAQAATFCLRQQGGQPQCLYDDAAECRRRAGQINGLCTVNPDIMPVLPTNGKICLITSGLAVSCLYIDRGSCEKEAQRKKDAVCVDSTQQGVQTDPHRENPARQY